MFGHLLQVFEPVRSAQSMSAPRQRWNLEPGNLTPDPEGPFHVRSFVSLPPAPPCTARVTTAQPWAGQASSWKAPRSSTQNRSTQLSRSSLILTSSMNLTILYSVSHPDSSKLPPLGGLRKLLRGAEKEEEPEKLSGQEEWGRCRGQRCQAKAKLANPGLCLHWVKSQLRHLLAVGPRTHQPL